MMPTRRNVAQDCDELNVNAAQGSPVPDVVSRYPPEGAGAPVVFDVPHAGRYYPEEFRPAVPVEYLHGGEDRFVDHLLARSPAQGATLIVANFARTFIDPNRSVTDIDEALLTEPWPYAIEPSPHGTRGTGLVFRVIGDAIPIYDRKLSTDEVKARIRNYYVPYHELLQGAIDEVHRSWGAVWYVTWHSMTSVGNLLSPDLGLPRADFVLGDRDGTACDPSFTDFVARSLRGLGYEVAINDPYKGAELVARHGVPAKSRHALQVEIRRGLYMDEQTLRKHAGFAALQADLDAVSRRICDYALEIAQLPSGQGITRQS
jgi:N-formylglutamate deformylase